MVFSSVREPVEQKMTVKKSKNICLSDIRLLIVDDNRDIVALFTAHCEQLGMQVRYSFDGVEGLQCAQTWNPDIVI